MKEWTPSTPYKEGDIFSYNGCLYKIVDFGGILYAIKYEDMKNSLDKRIAQRNALHSFFEGHNEDFYIQVNFCAPRSAEHVCVGLGHDDAKEIRRIVEEFIIKATS